MQLKKVGKDEAGRFAAQWVDSSPNSIDDLNAFDGQLHLHQMRYFSQI